MFSASSVFASASTIDSLTGPMVNSVLDTPSLTVTLTGLDPSTYYVCLETATGSAGFNLGCYLASDNSLYISGGGSYGQQMVDGGNISGFPATASMIWHEYDNMGDPVTSTPAPDIYFDSVGHDLNATETCVSLTSPACAEAPNVIGNWLAGEDRHFQDTTGFAMGSTTRWMGDNILMPIVGNGIGIIYALRYWIIVLLVIGGILTFAYTAFRFYKH